MLDARLPQSGEGKRRAHAETRLVTPAAGTGRDTLDWLERRITQLICHRQELRAAGAGRDLLESNRRELVRAQQALSGLLIARNLYPAA